MRALPVSPLSLNQLTRDYWGQYDPAIIAQLSMLANDPCYQIKFYKAPADDQEVVPAYGYVTYGMRVTPGSLIFGFYLPMVVDTESPTLSAPPQFTVQITDVSLEHKWWDEPVASIFLSNFKPTYQSDVTLNMGSFPNLMCAPYPVVGSGQFDVEIQETSGAEQRIELVFGVLEVCNVG
ncbi:MAG TPA: hypothetical protein VN794_21815 [Methylomirabilota bacterium]|nr:hypothetical protein [Methylomirabilota bacterium]